MGQCAPVNQGCCSKKEAKAQRFCATKKQLIGWTGSKKVKNMKKTMQSQLPPDLRQADELLEKYGRWAQDRWKKQRCASAEGRYEAPRVRRNDPDDEPMEPFIPDWSARQIQLALQVVPMQFRRVLFAIYIPQKEHPMAARRRMRLKPDVWEGSRIEGLRYFWNVYRLRYLTKSAIIAPTLRETDSCAPVG